MFVMRERLYAHPVVVEIDIIQWNSNIIFYHILLCFEHIGVYTPN